MGSKSVSDDQAICHFVSTYGLVRTHVLTHIDRCYDFAFQQQKTFVHRLSLFDYLQRGHASPDGQRKQPDVELKIDISES